jgi:nitroreductase
VVKKPYVSIALKLLKRYKIDLKSRSTADIQGPAAAMQNLVLMAHALGYSSCWMTGPLIAKEKLESILGIEPHDELMALVPIGKAAEPAKPIKRKNVKEIIRYL